jgi:hypothetical protein
VRFKENLTRHLLWGDKLEVQPQAEEVVGTFGAQYCVTSQRTHPGVEASARRTACSCGRLNFQKLRSFSRVTKLHLSPGASPSGLVASDADAE